MFQGLINTEYVPYSCVYTPDRIDFVIRQEKLKKEPQRALRGLLERSPETIRSEIKIFIYTSDPPLRFLNGHSGGRVRYHSRSLDNIGPRQAIIANDIFIA